MELEKELIPDELNKSFIREKIEGKYFFDDDDDDLSSNNLIPSSNSNIKNLTESHCSNPSSNVLNLFDSFDVSSKKDKLPFFRKLTRTNCDILNEEEKELNEKILLYYKKATMKRIDVPEDKNFISIIQGLNETILNVDSQEINLNDSKCLGNIRQSIIEQLVRSKKHDKELEMFAKNKLIFASSKSINFNILIAGEKSSGKTTFIKNFLKIKKKRILESQQNLSLEDPIFDSNISTQPTVGYKSYNFPSSSLDTKIEFKIKLIDSPGYVRSNSHKKTWVNDILNFIKSRNEEYFYLKESNENQQVSDCRIHLCLFFFTSIDPLRENDLGIMKYISEFTNLIPIVGQGDNITNENKLNCYKNFQAETSKRNIKILELDTIIRELCDDELHTNQLLLTEPPFIISKQSLDNTIYTLYDNNSVMYRIYTIIICFIPFECIKQTKNFYKKFKKDKIKEETKIEIRQTQMKKISYLGGLGVFGLGLCCLFLSKTK